MYHHIATTIPDHAALLRLERVVRSGLGWVAGFVLGSDGQWNFTSSHVTCTSVPTQLVVAIVKAAAPSVNLSIPLSLRLSPRLCIAAAFVARDPRRDARLVGLETCPAFRSFVA